MSNLSIERRPGDDYLIIAVMGATGTGKSTFINLASGSNLTIGNGLRSCTTSVEHSSPFVVQRRRVVLVDTPGFDDTLVTDTDILKMIGLYMATTFKLGQKLSGVIYMHRITDHRVGGTSRKNFRLFRKLCGDKTLQNVIITTNMWNQVERHVGEAREYELRTDDILFKPVLDHGAQMRRHDGSRQSALAILQTIVLNHPMTLLIQTELVTDKKDITQTAAGKELDHEATELRKQQQKEIEELKEQLEEAKVAADLQAQDELEKARQDAEEKVKLAERSRELLSQHYAEDRTRVEEEIGNLLGELRMQAGALVVPNVPGGSKSHPHPHPPPRDFVSRGDEGLDAQNSVGETPRTPRSLLLVGSNPSSQSINTLSFPDSRTVTTPSKSSFKTESRSLHTQGSGLVHPPSLQPTVLSTGSQKPLPHLPLELDAKYTARSPRQTDPPFLSQQRGALSTSGTSNLSSISNQVIDNRNLGIVDPPSPRRRKSRPQASVQNNYINEDASEADEKWLELVRKVLHEEIPKILSEGQARQGNMFAIGSSGSMRNLVDDLGTVHSSSQSRTSDTDLYGDLRGKQPAGTGGWHSSEVPPPMIQRVLSLTRAEIRASVAPRFWEMQQEIEWLKREIVRAKDERAAAIPGYELVGAVVDVLEAKGLLPRMTEDSESE